MSYEIQRALQPIPEASTASEVKETIRTLVEMLEKLYDFDDLHRTHVNVHVGECIVIVARLEHYTQRPVSNGDFEFGKTLAYKMIGARVVDQRMVKSTAVLRFEASLKDAVLQKQSNARQQRNDSLYWLCSVLVALIVTFCVLTGADVYVSSAFAVLSNSTSVRLPGFLSFDEDEHLVPPSCDSTLECEMDVFPQRAPLLCIYTQKPVLGAALRLPTSQNCRPL